MRTMTRLTYCSLAALLSFSFIGLFVGGGTAFAQEGDTAPPVAESTDTTAGDSATTDTATDAPAEPSVTPPTASVTDVPVNLRLRRLEERVQALKERAWRAKARIGMLKEAVLGGGVGARTKISHVNKMGNSYRLIKLVYALDGAQVFARVDPSGKLHDAKPFDVLSGPISPGSHTISVMAIYRGHGYGVFKYLKRYKYTVRSSHTFTASEGKGTDIQVNAFEKGGVTTPLEDRPAFDFKVNVSENSKGN